MGRRHLELIAVDEPAIVAKLVLDAVVVGSEQYVSSRLHCADESDWFEVDCKTSDLLDQLIASEQFSQRW